MDRKQKVFEFIKETRNTPLRLDELMAVLEVPESDKEEFTEVLRQLLREDKLHLTKKKRYAYNEKGDCHKAKFVGHDKGFGFAELLEEEGQDIFIKSDCVNGAMNGDTVLIKIVRQATEDRRSEGEVVEILERANTRLVGTFQKCKNFGFVIADEKKMNMDIYIPSKGINGAKNGQKVVCRLTQYGGKNKKPEGKIVEVIGFPDEADNDILSVIKQYGLSEEFPKKVMAEAKRVSKISDEDKKGRLDLTGEPIITIDGDDAKDLDDAISLKKLENGDYYLGVHIADVSHYVRDKSQLDKEAFERGTSVYLVDRVIPMLPRELSNGICSLNPHEDRLAMSTFMTIDQSGKVKDHQVHPSVIRSCHRMTYRNVTRILEGDSGEDLKQYKDIEPMLFQMKELAMLLREKRRARGSLDFNFPECKVELDENNRPVGIYKYELSISNFIIEEFMLITNETIAEYVFWQNKPFVYRIHEEPESEKMQKFFILVKNLGYRIKMPKEIKPRQLLEILELCKGKKEEKIISTIMLRSLMKAKYSPENKGHYGLAAKYYCHFTSPIRRYPDLIIHRILKLILENKMEGEALARYQALTERAALQSSDREMIADNAERDTQDIKKAEYMQQFIGEEMEGIISSVTGFGIFVELENTIEGLIRYADIEGEFFDFIETNYTAVGKRTGKTFSIGDRVRVRVKAASPALRQIDFELL